MKPWQYLLVDVDGTLLDSRGHLSARNLAALSRAAAAGLTLVLATGRTWPSLMRITEGQGLPPFHLITNGGAVGLLPDLSAAPYTRFLPPALWPRVVAALQAEGLSPAVFRHRHPAPPQVCIASVKGDPHFEAYMGRNQALARVVPDLAGATFDDVIEVAALGAGAHFDAASERVCAQFRQETENHTMVLFIATRFGKITEFFRADTSKWHAFLGLFPAAAAHPERVIAIGDEANDQEMIECAGLGIAMGNGIGELKAVADRVTAGHDEDGLALALEQVLEEMEAG